MLSSWHIKKPVPLLHMERVSAIGLCVYFVETYLVGVKGILHPVVKANIQKNISLFQVVTRERKRIL